MAPAEPGREEPRYREFRFCPRCGSPFRPEDFHEAECLLLCSHCTFDFYQNPLPAAVVAIADPGRPGELMFLKRRTPPGIGLWCVPGGFIRYGEAPEAAAAREALEEVGAEVRIGPVLRAGLVDYLYRGRRLCILEVAYLATLLRGTAPAEAAVSTSEASEVSFLCVDEVLRNSGMLAFPEQASVLRAFRSVAGGDAGIARPGA